MRAAAFTEFGGPDVFQVIELPAPTAGSGEVVVKVAASTVNPTDTLMRSGKQADLMRELSPPYIDGVEFAGWVHQLGAGVAGFAVGQKVMGIVNARRPGGGAHAEFVCVPADSLAALDASADLVAAATVPMNGLTAKMCVEMLELQPGATILVTGGAGAAGSYAIQIAKQFGLVVIADAKDADAALLRSLGADHVVPRGEGMADAIRRICPNGVDGMIDAALIGDAAAASVRDGGTTVSLRRTHPITDPRVRSLYVMVFNQATNAEALRWLGEMLKTGKLTPRVAARLPMAQAGEAHRLVEQGGLRGRVVLTFDGSAD